MSVNVYLKGDVEKMPAFKHVPVIKDVSFEKHELYGVEIRKEKGRWFLSLYDMNDQVPSTLANLVDEISYRDYLPNLATREPGIYVHETASVEVVPELFGKGQLKYRVAGSAKKMADLRDFVHHFLVGEIRPQKSYVGPQAGKSTKDLVEEVEALKRERTRLQEALIPGQSLTARAVDLSGRLSREKWPFCLKSRILSSINYVVGANDLK
jgi:hypothetical protein